MNPDVTLALMRDAVLDYHAAADTDEALEAADVVITSFKALDAHLTLGHRPPERWSASRVSQST